MSENIPAAAPNPALTQWAFFYTAVLDGNPVYNVYRNTTPTFTGASKLTTNDFEFVGTIEYTPDGNKIIFTASLGANDFGVYSMNTNGTGLVRLGDGEEAFSNAVGDKLVITRLTAGAGEIGTMNMNGSGFVNVSNNPAEDIHPQWSKDGTKIYFASNRNGNFDVFRMNANGASPTAFSSHADDEFGPSPNENESQAAFSVISVNPNDIGVYRIDANGANRTRIVDSTSVGQRVFWSPTTSGDAVAAPIRSIDSWLPKRIRTRLSRR